MKTDIIELGDITSEVIFKNIRNIHLSVYPPAGKVRISAPEFMDLETIRVFAVSRLSWIKKQRRKIMEQERETLREYTERESHFVWGKRYLLIVRESENPPAVELTPRNMILHMRPGTDDKKKTKIVEEWYRRQLRVSTATLLAKWEPVMGVKVVKLFVRRMKTRWGSCNHTARTIRLNTDLSKKPPESLEYIIIHELAHLIEPSHNNRFIALMDKYMPNWHVYRDQLNRLPVRHENWSY